MKCNHRFRPVKAVGLLVPECTNARGNAGCEPRSRYRPPSHVEGWGFFRVGRTEVMQLPAVWQDSHVTPPRSTSQSRSSPSGAPGHLENGARVRIAVCHPQWECMVRPPASFAWLPALPGGDNSNLLSPDMLQRMQALEQRVPLLYGYPPQKPSSR